MKYLKYFESVNEPQVGEYVIANGEKYPQNIQEFFLTNIGKIRRSDPKSLAPDDPDNEFEVEIYDDSGVFVVDYENKIPWDNDYNTSKLHNYTVLFYGTEILYHSKSKENCEMFIRSKKFNI